MTDYRQTTGKKSRKQTSGFWNGAKNAGQDLVHGTQDAVTNTAESVDNTIDNTAETVQNAGESAGEAFQDTQDSGGVFGQTQDAARDFSQTFGETAGDVADTAFGGGEEAVDFLAGSGTGEDLEETFTDFTSGAQDAVEDTANDLGSTFENTVDSATDFAGSLGGDAWDAASGAGDFLAGNIDESIARTFDNQQGGGVFAGVNNTLDNLSGSVDESIGRQFDDTAGGGILDPVANLGGDAFGLAGDAVNFGTDIVNGGIEGAMSLGDMAKNAVTGSPSSNSQKNWGELSEVEQRGSCVIMEQESSIGDTRYLSVSSNQNSQTVAIESDGSMVVIENVSSVSEMPWHNKLTQARNACDNADLPKQWGELSEEETHSGAVIFKQSAGDGSERFLAITSDGSGGQVAIAADGSTVPMDKNSAISDLPTYPIIGAARDAINKAVPDSRQWGPLNQVGEEGNCIIMKQESSDDNTRYFTITQSREGDTIAVANDGTGTVVSSVDNAQNLPHYPSESDARAACPSNGEAPSNGGSNEPTDDSTSNGGPTTDSSQSGGSYNSAQPADSGAMSAGLLSGEVAGIPIPVIGGGAVVAAGALASLLGGDDSRPTPSRVPATRTRTSARSNVIQRVSDTSNQNNGNNEGR